MRLDKFLKVSRLIKRRTVAKQVSDAGKITINGRPAKASTDVKVGDKITLHYGNHQTEVEILQIAETVKADQASSLYKVISEASGQ